MRKLHLTLAAAALIITCGESQAQYRYGPNGGYRSARPVFPGYTPVFPVAPPVAFPGVYQDFRMQGAANVVRSLYLQNLGREPDPQGMQTWMRRYADLGGDVARLSQEFAQSAYIEQNANNPAYRFRPY